MSAIVKQQCGANDCLCTFLLFDIDLLQEWLKSFRQFAERSKASLKNIKPSTLFMPWTLGSLAEHEECFQQWCILQLLVGTVVTIAVFALYVVWSSSAESAVKIPMGSIIINAMLRFSIAFLATWIIWFGVIAKHGCCCMIGCCCLGKPNILVVAIVEGFFALFTAMTVIEALNHGHVLLILAGAIVCTHFVTQVYLTAEAFVVWLKSRETSTPSSQETVVGPPVILGQRASTHEKREGVAKEDVDACTKEGTTQGHPDENQESAV